MLVVIGDSKDEDWIMFFENPNTSQREMVETVTICLKRTARAGYNLFLESTSTESKATSASL